ncbi:MAG: hypothetical protein LBD21_09265 [Tannerellaceae bacterium]|jgi:hypothetical protein|nr:hypothetical protein [Tannerellaceae bacterium]
MLRINRNIAIIVLSLAIIPISLSGQNNTSSPYTRYGYGALADRSFGAGRAMGGIGYGLRSNKQINPMNPASYSGMDSLTFLFDFGISGQMSWFSDGVNTDLNRNGNLEYIAMQFPVHRRVALSFGLLPYSYVGYLFGAHTPGANPYTESFVGKGGLNDVYGGLSIDIWKKRLSLGANVGYLFGNLSHVQTLYFDSEVKEASASERTQSLTVNDIKFDFGLQYTHPISRSEHYTVGLAFSPGKQLRATSSDISKTGSLAGDTVSISNQVFDIASSLGFGLSYVKQNKLTLAADFLYQPWSGARFFDNTGQFQNRMRAALGLEYIKDYSSRNFFNKTRYRAGVHYGNSYLQINNKGYNEIGASFGLGIPLIDNRSLLNIGFEYVQVKPEVKTLIDERYFRITINYTFNEGWFYKFKVD